MSKNVIRILSLIMVIAIVLAFAVGCQKKAEQTTSQTTSNSTVATQEPTTTAATVEKPFVWKPDPEDLEWKKDTSPVTLKVYFNNTWICGKDPWPWGNDDVSREITKRTGVTLEGTTASDEDGTQLNLMLASGEKLPDLIVGLTPSNPAFSRMYKDQLMISITDLMDKYAPNMRKVMVKGEEEFAAQADGKLYHLGMTMTGYDQMDDPRVAAGYTQYAVRGDIMKEIGNPQIKTPDDLLAVLKTVKEKYPEITYPALFNENFTGLSWPLHLTFGGVSSYDGMAYDKNKGCYYWVEDEAGYKAMKFMNTLYREGLINPESFSVTDAGALLKKGNVFLYGMNNSSYNQMNVNPDLAKNKPGAYYDLMLPIVDPGAKYQLISNYKANTWMGTVVTKDANVERTIKYLEFMISDEGQQLLFYGINGVHSDMVKNEQYGWWYPVYKPEEKNAFQKDFTTLQNKWGIYNLRYLFLTRNLYDLSAYWDINNTPSSDELVNRSNEIKKQMTDFTILNKTQGLGSVVAEEAGTDPATIRAKMNDYLKNQIPKCIIAPTDEKFKAEYDIMLADLKTIGEEKWQASTLQAVQSYLAKAQKAGLTITD